MHACVCACVRACVCVCVCVKEGERTYIHVYMYITQYNVHRGNETEGEEKREGGVRE